jgi:hypothetical protein
MTNMERSPFIHIQPQPDFPASDLTANNANVLPFILDEGSGVEAHARLLQDHQHGVYDIAHRILVMSELPASHSLIEYQAYTRGFATFEAMSSIVHPVMEYNTSYAAAKLAKLTLRPLLLLDKAQSWPDERPNTHSAVMKVGVRRGETHNELRARSLGAHLAFELQRPLLDVA